MALFLLFTRSLSIACDSLSTIYDSSTSHTLDSDYFGNNCFITNQAGTLVFFTEFYNYQSLEVYSLDSPSDVNRSIPPKMIINRDTKQKGFFSGYDKYILLRTISSEYSSKCEVVNIPRECDRLSIITTKHPYELRDPKAGLTYCRVASRGTGTLNYEFPTLSAIQGFASIDVSEPHSQHKFEPVYGKTSYFTFNNNYRTYFFKMRLSQSYNGVFYSDNIPYYNGYFVNLDGPFNDNLEIFSPVNGSIPSPTMTPIPPATKTPTRTPSPSPMPTHSPHPTPSRSPRPTPTPSPARTPEPTPRPTPTRSTTRTPKATSTRIPPRPTMSTPRPSSSALATTKPVPTTLTPTRPIPTTLTPTRPGSSTLTPTRPIQTTLTPTRPIPSTLSTPRPSQTTLTPTRPGSSTLTPTRPSQTSLAPTRPGSSTLATTRPSPTPLSTSTYTKTRDPTKTFAFDGRSVLITADVSWQLAPVHRSGEGGDEDSQDSGSSGSSGGSGAVTAFTVIFFLASAAIVGLSVYRFGGLLSHRCAPSSGGSDNHSIEHDPLHASVVPDNAYNDGYSPYSDDYFRNTLIP